MLIDSASQITDELVSAFDLLIPLLTANHPRPRAKMLGKVNRIPKGDVEKLLKVRERFQSGM